MTGSEEERRAFMAKAMDVLTTAMKLKKVMLKRGKTVAACKCPWCKNDTFTGRLCGPRNHMHARCTFEGCGAMLME